MALGEDNSIISEVTVVVRVELETFGVEEEDSHEVGDGGCGGGVA